MFLSSECSEGPLHEKAHPLGIQIPLNAPDLSSIMQAPETPFPLASSPGCLEGVNYFNSNRIYP